MTSHTTCLFETAVANREFWKMGWFGHKGQGFGIPFKFGFHPFCCIICNKMDNIMVLLTFFLAGNATASPFSPDSTWRAGGNMHLSCICIVVNFH